MDFGNVLQNEASSPATAPSTAGAEEQAAGSAARPGAPASKGSTGKGAQLLLAGLRKGEVSSILSELEAKGPGEQASSSATAPPAAGAEEHSAGSAARQGAPASKGPVGKGAQLLLAGVRRGEVRSILSELEAKGPGEQDVDSLKQRARDVLIGAQRMGLLDSACELVAAPAAGQGRTMEPPSPAVEQRHPLALPVLEIDVSAPATPMALPVPALHGPASPSLGLQANHFVFI